jgi:site-specific DNA-methyltransferase (adenine-specific)
LGTGCYCGFDTAHFHGDIADTEYGGEAMNGAGQLLPDLPPWEYETLRDSIRRYGVILSVVKDEQGLTIDGHQRERACRELGMKDYPVLTLAGLTEEEKRDHVHILNLVRRRLTRSQMRDLIAAELRRTPELSSNWLAQILGTTDKTVEAVRRELIATSVIPKFEQYKGKDGKLRRVTRVMTHTARAAERAQQALQILGDDAPDRDWSLKFAERKVRRLQKLEMTKGRKVQPPAEGDIRLFHCPFQRLEEVAGIEPVSVNLVLTDIPYDGEFLNQVPDLAALAERILVPGGLFVTYCGHYYLNQVISMLDAHLKYRWTRASVWEGVGNIIHPRNVTSKWKPILVYSKGEWVERPRWYDVTQVESREKDWHEWQQPLEEVERLIKDYSEPGDLVVDPCGGGFTTAVACKRLGRRCISCDIDEAAVIRGQDRLAEASQDRPSAD